ncbi:MAG: sigma-70 family RNA polymerase sigma factor [Syntrophaceae bacterium]|nr:sigma-70 family RNA polymerase sigma factor [Syntrophaceae bacterium]
MDRYRGLAYNSAYRMLGDPDAAEDAAQESFIAAYQGLKDFKFGSRFSTWLYTIVMNKCRDCLRAKRPNVSFDDLTEVRPDRKPSPEERAASHQAGDIIQEALNALPPDYREVIILKHVQDLDYTEIADILGTSVGSLKVRAHRGREMLKKAIEKAGVNHG